MYGRHKSDPTFRRSDVDIISSPLPKYNVSSVVLLGVGTQIPCCHLVRTLGAIFTFAPVTQRAQLEPRSGAGIGGLALAITIGKYDPSIPIDLYEAHDAIDTAGVGITVPKKTQQVLIALGLFDDFRHTLTHDPEQSRGELTVFDGVGFGLTATSGPTVRRSDMREGGYPWFHRADRCEFSPLSIVRTCFS